MNKAVQQIPTTETSKIWHSVASGTAVTMSPKTEDGPVRAGRPSGSLMAVGCLAPNPQRHKADSGWEGAGHLRAESH